MIEVLSPVGSQQALIAAVRSGADAVYLGAKSFSARRNATNFDHSELIEAITYAHRYRVKVYVTVNIEVKEDEFGSVYDLLAFLNDQGVDGVIVQDLGVAKIVHENFPDLPLHGSTQMSVHHASALPFLAERGFKRIVVARELNRDELREFCQCASEYHIEVEHFVHGALCMSVSGQCLLSAMIGQRSGNRGLCAQPCRLPFTVSNGCGHDLSLKDQSLFNYVNEMKEMGVASLKIEGRMKRPEYVALASYCCRQAVDNKPYDDELLRKVFSRSGFTRGYYENKLGREMFGIRTEEDEKASRESFNQIHELYRAERQKVALDLQVEVHKDQPITVRSDDIMVRGEAPLIADNKATGKEDIENSLKKLGNTAYYLNSLQADIDEGLYCRSSALNDLRRQLVERLDEKAVELPLRRSLPLAQISSSKNHQLKKTYVRLFTGQQMPKCAYYDGLIIPVNFDVPNIDKEIIVEIPRWIFNEEYIEERLEYYKKQGIRKCYCNNLSAVVLARKHDLEIMGGSFLNLTNSYALKNMTDYGAGQLTLSSELSLKDISRVKSDGELGIISYGYLPLMLLKNCPLKNGRKCSECDKKGFITDRTNTRFPIRCSFTMSELFNSTPIYLADKQEDLQNVDYQILYFTIESPQEVDQIIQAYHDCAASNKAYTRGLYYRSVL